ncbi:hypothetical protein BH23VER1_BH23VER1_00230 [soil metagenome]
MVVAGVSLALVALAVVGVYGVKWTSDHGKKDAEPAGLLITTVIPTNAGAGSGAIRADSEDGDEEADAREEERLNQARRALVEEAVVTISDFFATSSVEGKAGSVVDAGRVLPLMQEYYERRAPEPFEEADFMPVRALRRFVDAEMAVFTLIPRREASRPTGDPYEDAEALLYFIPGEDGRPKLDWETYVQTKDKSVFKYIERPRDAPATFRLSLAAITSSEREDGELVLDASDPAMPSRQFEVLVPAGSVADEIRTGLGEVPRDRFATVSLHWGSGGPEDSPRLEIGELICWGFLGTGWDDGAAPPPIPESLVGR